MLKTEPEKENATVGASFNPRSLIEPGDKIEISTQGQGDTRNTNPIEDMSTIPKTVKTENPIQQEQKSPRNDENGSNLEEVSDPNMIESSGILQKSIEDVENAEVGDDEEIYTGANAEESKLNDEKGNASKDVRPKQKPFSLKSLHLPEIHLPRKFNRGAGNTHDQLVEEPCSPVNTLEREQVQFKESLEYHSNIKNTRSVGDRAADSWRGFTSRARKHLHNLTTCSCVRSRDQADISVKYRKETTVELPPDINAVSNENAEI